MDQMAENNNNVQLSKTTQGLINDVSHFFPGDVEVQFIGNLKSGYVRHDQAQVVQDGDRLYVQINDLTEPDFTATHELLHLLMTLRGFPQIYFPLTSGDKQLDEQLMYMGTELYDDVCHFVVYSEQRKHDLVDERIEKEYVKGVRQTITPESGKVDDEMPLRLVTILDAMIFLGDHFDQFADVFQRSFPISLKAAKELYAMLTEKPVDSPFALRRDVVKLYRDFDKQMKKWGLPPLQLNDFVMMTAVFSKRQLGLQVKQVFNLYHSELKETKTGKRAYVGFTKSDDQNSFVTSGPAGKQASEDYFKELYSKTVKELYQDLRIPYLLR
ncbi:hypothetical protein FRFR103141_05565 [Fructilactobacillus fructivorans]